MVASLSPPIGREQEPPAAARGAVPARAVRGPRLFSRSHIWAMSLPPLGPYPRFDRAMTGCPTRLRPDRDDAVGGCTTDQWLGETSLWVHLAGSGSGSARPPGTRYLHREPASPGTRPRRRGGEVRGPRHRTMRRRRPRTPDRTRRRHAAEPAESFEEEAPEPPAVEEVEEEAPPPPPVDTTPPFIGQPADVYAAAADASGARVGYAIPEAATTATAPSPSTARRSPGRSSRSARRS